MHPYFGVSFFLLMGRKRTTRALRRCLRLYELVVHWIVDMAWLVGGGGWTGLGLPTLVFAAAWLEARARHGAAALSLELGLVENLFPRCCRNP